MQKNKNKFLISFRFIEILSIFVSILTNLVRTILNQINNYAKKIKFNKINKSIKFLLLIIIIFIYLKVVIADLTCSISTTNSCSGNDIALLRLQNGDGGYDNAQAQLANYSGTKYTNTLCCNSTSNPSLNNTCGTSFLKLSNNTNAHVQNSSYSNYDQIACISSTTQPTCLTSSGSCPVNYVCLSSIASSTGNNATNAHLGSCSKYNLKVCCKVNSPPSAPFLNLPLNSSFFNATYLKVEINGSNDADTNDTLYYILEVSTDFAFSNTSYYNGTIRKIVNATNEHNITDTLADGIYHFRLRSTDLSENSSYTEIRNFTFDNTIPTNLTLLSPNNNTQGTNRTPLFTWNNVTEANFANYTLEIDDDADFSSIQFTYSRTNNLTNSTFQVTTLFTWNNVTEANFANYTLEIDDDADFSSIQFTYSRTNNLTNSTFQVITLLNDNTKYYWKITAADKANNRNSSVFVYTTFSTGGPGAGSGSSGGGGGGGSSGGGKTILADFELIEPGLLSMYSNDTLLAPILIKNKGQSNLNNIIIEATTNSSDLSLELDRIFIPLLLPGQEDKVLLKIKSHTEPGQYEIIIKATVSNPSISDTARIIITLLGRDLGKKGDSEKQLEFLKKLISGNPECLELRELVTQAEEAIKKEQYEKAVSLSDAAVQGCKDFIKARDKEVKLPQELKVNDMVILALELIAFSFIGYGTYYYYKRRRIKLRLKR